MFVFNFSIKKAPRRSARNTNKANGKTGATQVHVVEATENASTASATTQAQAMGPDTLSKTMKDIQFKVNITL